MKPIEIEKKSKTGKKKRKTAFFDWALWMLEELQRRTLESIANGFKY